MMIVTITLISLAIGIALTFYSNRGQNYNNNISMLKVAGTMITFLSWLVLFIVTICVISVNFNTDARIKIRQMQYETLCKQAEIVKNDESLSVLVVGKVQDWNEAVSQEKYWAKNIWTNIFFNQRVVDSLQFIELDFLE